jgi:hypothetical protein
VDLRFDPDDENAFAALSRRLLELFEATPEGADHGWVANQLLSFKQGYLGGDDLGRWTSDDLSEVLFELYPRKVVLEPGDNARVIGGIAAFLRFLETEGLWTGEESSEELASLVERGGARFDVAMADESRWGPGKRLFSGAAAQGVDISDQRQLDEYIRTFNSLPYAERDARLGPQLAPPRLPPVVLAPPEELRRAAEASTVLRWVRGLIEFVGEGRKLTDKGNLKLADGKALVERLDVGDVFDPVIGDTTFSTRSTEELPDLHLTFELAKAAEFLADDGSRIVPTESAAMAFDQPMEAVHALWLSLLEDVQPAQHRWRWDHYGYGWYAEDIDDALIPWHLDMYVRQGGLDLAEEAARMWPDLVEDYALEGEPSAKLDFHRQLMARTVLTAFHRLEQLGTIRLEDVEVGSGQEMSGVAHLTPLGTWVVHHQLARFMPAPVVGALADLPADELLRQVVDRPEDAAGPEVRYWIDRHGADGLPALVSGLPGASEAARGVVLGVLLDLGEEAVAAVEPLRDDPELAPFRTVLRVDAGVAAESEMVAAGPEEWVRLLAAVTELRSPAAATAWAGPAAGEVGVVGMLDVAWRVRLPQTATVLAVLGSAAPDKAVAKAARRAAHKHRSASR